MPMSPASYGFPDMPCMNMASGHALHRTGLQRQNKRRSTGQFTKDFDCSCFREEVQDSCLPCSGGGGEGCLLGEPTRRRPILPRPPATLQCDAPHCPACGVSGFWIRRVTKTIRRRFIFQQPGTKSARCPADKTLVNRPLCSPIGLHKILYVRVPGGTFRPIVFSMPWKARGTVVS